MLRISEIYEKKIKNTEERHDGSEYVTYSTAYDTRPCLINKDYIVAVHPHSFRSSIIKQKVLEAFPSGTKFSTLVLDGNSFRKSELLVVGSFEMFCEMLDK